MQLKWDIVVLTIPIECGMIMSVEETPLTGESWILKYERGKQYMSIIRVTDQWNQNKVWVIKRYACGHYYVEQEIKGRRFGTRAIRTTKYFLQEVGLV